MIATDGYDRFFFKNAADRIAAFFIVAEPLRNFGKDIFTDALNADDND